MHRLALRPFLNALRIQRPTNHAVRLVRSASVFSGGRPPSAGEASPRIKIDTKSLLDPAGMYTPAEYVDVQLKSSEVQEFVKTLSPEDKQHYDFLYSQLSKENGHSNPAALDEIGVFLEQRGVELDLPPQLFEPPLGTEFPEYRPGPEPYEVSWEDPETQKTQSFRSITDPIAALDARSVFNVPRSRHEPYGVTITTYNGIAIKPSASQDEQQDADAPPRFRKTAPSGPLLTMSKGQMDHYYTSVLLSRRVVHQTGKGKVRSAWYLVLTGNGNGLVGYGQGKHAKARVALQQARASAIKNMDFVERFESRTVWTELTAKLGATRLMLRPRPVGFGLRCNPYLHQVLRAAGFKDISAKVWGSRNRMNVIKCAFMLLQAGHAPPGMGDGLGGKGVKLSRGVGMVGKLAMERARGRKLISLRK